MSNNPTMYGLGVAQPVAGSKGEGNALITTTEGHEQGDEGQEG